MNLRVLLALLLRLGLAAILIAAGALKLRDPSAFALEISNFQLLPDLAPYLAVLLPTTEILVGAVVLVAPRPWRQAAALAALGLFAMFTVAVVNALARGINVDCGCFGSGSGPVSGLTIVRNAALLAGTLLLLLVDAPRATPPRPLPARS